MKLASVLLGTSGTIGLAFALPSCADKANPVIPLHPQSVLVDGGTSRGVVVGGPASLGGPGLGGPGPITSPGGGSGSHYAGLAECTKEGQGNCCYPNTKDSPISGTPPCSWKRMAPGESITITEAWNQDTSKWGTLPVPVQITTVAPASYASLEECNKSPVGFLVTAPGLKDQPWAVSDIANFTIKTDGTWSLGGAGATMGLTVLADSTPGLQRDGPPPAPHSPFEECDQLARADRAAAVPETGSIEFTLGGVDYESKFYDPNNRTGITGLFIRVDKAF